MLAGFDLPDYIRFNSGSRLGTDQASIAQTSGAAHVVVGSEEHLFTIHNSPDEIREFRLRERDTPLLLRTIEIEGFVDNPQGDDGGDTEGITYLGPGIGGGHEFAIVEERLGLINVLTVPSSGANPINKSTMTQITPSPTIINGGNDGLEGIAFRANGAGTADDVFYVVKEFDGANRGVWQVNRSNGAATQLTVCSNPSCAVGTRLYDLVGDLSDIHYAKVNGVDTLFLLSEEGPGDPDENRVLRVTVDGTSGLISETLALPDNEDFLQPEGLTFTPNGSDMIVVGEPSTNATSQFFHYRVGGDADRDGTVDLEDLSDLVSNFGTGSGAEWAQGDFVGATVTETDEATGDETVSLQDLMLLRNRCDCGGGESLGGGGGSGGEEMSGGGEGGGGESLLTGDPARIYITTSGSTSGGGALPGTVPSALLDGPNDSVTLYVWATMGDYSFMNGYSIDIRATDEDVVKATESMIYNPEIVLSNYGNVVIGERWDDQYVTQSDLNDDGIGEELLVSGGNAFLLASGGGLNAAYDGSDAGGTLDELYDETNGAFLVQSFTLEALAGSAGLSTDIVLYVGGEGYSLDNLLGKSYLTFGLGEDQVANVDVGATDGTAHATINVAAQQPGALVMRASVIAAAGSTLDSIRPVARVRALVRDSGERVRAIDASFPVLPNSENELTARRRATGLSHRSVLRVATTIDSLALSHSHRQAI
jgi:uncharacterized protein YjiK